MMRFDNDYKALTGLLTQFKNVVVTTADLNQDYKVVGPIMQYISNMGVYADDYEKIKDRYTKAPYNQLLISIDEFNEKSEKACSTARKLYNGAIHGNEEIKEFQSELDTAAAISLSQLKLRAAGIGANAVIGVRIEAEIDPNNKNLFFIKMYGTAVDCKDLEAVVLPMDEGVPLI